MTSLPQSYTGTYPVCAESLLFLHHPVPMWVVDEETLRFLAVNDAAVARYGYTREEFLSMTSADIRSPEDLPRLRAQVASDDWRSHGMWRHRTKSGAWLDVEAMAHGVNFRGRRAVVVNAYDVSERVRQTGELEQARRELEASEARYRTLVESMEEIVWATDLFGVLTYVSPVVRRFGYAATELVGRPLWSLVHPDDVEPVRAACTPQFDCNRLPRDLRVVTRDGEVRRVRASARPQPVQTGAAASVTGVLSDITDTYVAMEQRQVAQRYELVGQLAGGVAHDFNNLLVVINGYAELAAASLDDEHPAREDLGQVIEAGNKAATLTQRLLAFGRKQMLQPRSVDLGATVHDMEGMLRRLIGEHIQLAIDCPPDLPTVYLDPAQFEHMLMNLAVNARDAMPTGGTLTIRTHFPQVGDTCDDGPSRDGLLCLSVSDTGHGMDASVQARIFDPFFTTRPLGQGSGLGLSMVQGFVEQSGGTIAVDSALGRGTTFRIGLPVEHAHPFDELQPRGMSRRDTAGTVLVTEDEPAVRALVARTLKDAGYDVLVPETPAAALDVCEHYTGTIDLLLTDVVMPGLNGQELASRAIASRPSMRVLFMSGYCETDRATVTGRDFAVLEKPFNAAALTRAVRDALMPDYGTCETTVTGV